MTKKTKIEKKVIKLNQLYQFYQKISKARETEKSYQTKKNKNT